MLQQLNFPKANLKLTKSGETVYVWDVFRNKKLILTPEEWVRQHTLHYLVNYKGVPSSLLSPEYSIKVNDLSRRCDGVIFDRKGKAISIIECKRPEVKLGEEIMHQVAQYNYKLRVKWLVLTNGLDTIVANINLSDGKIEYQKEVPSYEEMCKSEGKK